MNEQEELAHLTAPSNDPQQRMIDYWGRRCEKAEAEVERLTASFSQSAHDLAVARARIGQLVAALRATADQIDACREIARAALEGK